MTGQLQAPPSLRKRRLPPRLRGRNQSPSDFGLSRSGRWRTLVASAFSGVKHAYPWKNRDRHRLPSFRSPGLRTNSSMGWKRFEAFKFR